MIDAAVILNSPRGDRVLARVTQVELAREVPDADREQRRRQVAAQSMGSGVDDGGAQIVTRQVGSEQRREESEAEDMVEVEVREEYVDPLDLAPRRCVPSRRMPVPASRTMRCAGSPPVIATQDVSPP